MYTTCPKCHYTRKESDKGDEDKCPSCGLIFSKWMKQQFYVEDMAHYTHPETGESLIRRLPGILLVVPERTEGPVLAGRVVLFLIFFI